MSVTLHQLLNDLYGINTFYRKNPVTDTVNIATTQILKGNPNRVSLLIVNLSVNSIYISPDNDVSSSKGIFIASNGGFISMQWDKDFELVSSQFFATAAVDGSKIYVLENISK